ncbi:hypothetical protein [Streptomyces sp. NBC_00557]|uniref:hypothetical protein n=1 Tax=Streptomyces sp. NBC_00557 TaxID=2975776 RepID=UPI002E812A8F|nr:hypothetical protein [Streptomyces sp. NBC_00557]WUC33678.1 hypothetical protein OG956_05365 [Streptomyces sp. NBC_00557]
MKHRVALVVLFLLPALWGAGSLVGALTASAEVECPGENVGKDGEERPGPMRPGDTQCSVLDGSVAVATRTYEQQRSLQSLQRWRDVRNGCLLLMYGTGGALLTWRAARSVPDVT